MEGRLRSLQAESTEKDERLKRLQHQAEEKDERLATSERNEDKLKSDLKEALSYRKKCHALKQQVEDLQGRLHSEQEQGRMQVFRAGFAGLMTQ